MVMMNFMTKLAMVVMVGVGGLVRGHMMMEQPLVRRAKGHPGYTETQYDYSMTAPLNDGYAFPCRGYGPGPISQTYSAGDSISVKLSGGAAHNGGHCQWSLSYNDADFAVIKTVMGTCMVDTNDYQVPIPPDAPEGKVTLAWSWINRSGDREYYMNCADIYIKGSPSGHITGPRMFVADLPGYEVFPEMFANDYASEKYDAQPMITIRPGAGAAQPEPSRPPTTTVPEPTKDAPPHTTSVPEPPAGAKVCRDRKYPTQLPPPPKVEPKPQLPPHKGDPAKDMPRHNAGCKDNQVACLSDTVIAKCNQNTFYPITCNTGTTCKPYSDYALCM